MALRDRKLTVNIENYVKRLKDIDFMQPLYEAIVNSLDANAKNIKIKFDKEIIEREEKINGFSIVDDGDGFNDKNLDTFFEMMQMNKEKGKLGSGRFIWLKVFDNVLIESKIKKNNIMINFVRKYEDIKATEEIANNPKNQTKIIFSNVSKAYKNKRPNYDLVELTNKIKYQLLPKLLLLKQENKKFNIIIDVPNNVIDENNLPLLEKVDFEVKSNKGCGDFTLFYKIIKDGQGFNSGYYVAHGRQVKEFTKEVKIPKLPDNSFAIMFLSSKYFDDRINDDRNGFDIDMNIAKPLSFGLINDELKKHMDKILFDNLPQISNMNEQAKKDAIREKPYLSAYIMRNKDNIRTKTQWINYAKAELEKDETASIKDFKKILDDKKISSEEYEEIIYNVKRVGEIELGRYIAYRQQIINHLSKLQENASTSEAELHDVFVTYLDKEKKKELNKTQTYNKYADANLWLLDDKFMFYKNIFTDKELKDVKKNMQDEDSFYSKNNTEPDITIFYNKQKNNSIDVVVVEFKAIKIKQAEAKNKAISIEEINTNIGIIKEEFKNINNYYGFIITELDEKTTERLKRNDAQQLYSNGDIPYFYLYNKNNNSHTYIVDIRSIIQDANVRNKVFLDILKGEDKETGAEK